MRGQAAIRRGCAQRRRMVRTGFFRSRRPQSPQHRHPVLAADNFPPESVKPNTIFLFQGDSITDGGRRRDGDPNHAMGDSYAFSVASYLGEKHAALRPAFLNRGNSGDTSAQVRARWQADALDLHPDVISLLVGVNDLLVHCADGVSEETAQATSPAAYEDNLRAMLSEARSRNPSVQLLLGLPFFYRIDGFDPSVHWNDDATTRGFTMDFRNAVTQRNVMQRVAYIPQLQAVVRRVAADFGAALLDYPAAIDNAMKTAPIEYWVWDGIHVTCAGQRLLMRTWLDGYRTLQP